MIITFGRGHTVIDDRGGSPSVESAVLTVIVGLLIAFAIAGGRLVSAEAAADHAARSAARAASLHRDAASALAAAEQTARASLSEQELRCATLDIAADTSGFAVPLGTPASVRVTVRCAVTWSDLGLPGAPGTQDVQSVFVSPIDRWRERQ